MSWLLDVNVLLGCGWKSHPDNPALLDWLLHNQDWATCPLTESAFMRISLTTAYQATFDDTRRSLATLCALRGHRFLVDDVNAAMLPVLKSYKDTTDAHLVTPRQMARSQAGHLGCGPAGQTLGGRSCGKPAVLHQALALMPLFPSVPRPSPVNVRCSKFRVPRRRSELWRGPVLCGQFRISVH